MIDALRTAGNLITGGAIVVAGLALASLPVTNPSESASAVSIIVVVAGGVAIAGFGLHIIADGLEDDEDEETAEVQLSDGEEVTVSA